MPCWRSRLHVPPSAVSSRSWALQRCVFEEPHVICCASLWLGTSWKHEPRGVFLLPIWQMLADPGYWILFDAVFCPCWSSHWRSQPQRVLWVLFTSPRIMKAQLNLTWIIEDLTKFDILGIVRHSWHSATKMPEGLGLHKNKPALGTSVSHRLPNLPSLKMALRLGKRTLR